MKKIFIIFLFGLFGFIGCKQQNGLLDITPTNFLDNSTIFSDPVLVVSVLADFYNRYIDFSSLDNGWGSFGDFSEAFPSDGSYGNVKNTSWGYESWSTWDYTYVRELNLFLERIKASPNLLDADRKRFIAEGRFLRASYYFEMVKRMGGVPLILNSLSYDYSGDVGYLLFPREKESAIYDFVISEAEAIKDDLPANANTKSRASKAAALAMECRAALYAGSIAKYGASTPTVALPGLEVSIPADMARDYYLKALAAAKEIINGSAGAYRLYNNSTNLSDNFANIFLDKSSAETIFIEDFLTGKTHNFSRDTQPYSLTEEGGNAGRLNPSLNLVEQFEKLDNTFAPLATVDGANNRIYYTNVTDIFAGRDARLAGTVLLPGATFKTGTVDIWAGYQLANNTVLTSDQATNKKALPGTATLIQVVGLDGPVNNLSLHTQTGFYIRKYLDPTPKSGLNGTGSTVAFIRYRYAEVLLNAAEAAFETGDPATATNYLNQVRARAGLTVPLTPAQISFDRIVHERRVELAFEGHILFDMKRWRLAHLVWSGSATSLTELKANIGSATKKSTQPWGLWPYKYYDPNSVNNGKWIFKEILPAVVTGYNRFQMGNYYSFINAGITSANPKIVKQPNQ
ncbi:RagB/SusD family nutrient uptake outer membrane protein [Pedobacter miscanthi]|uniref:RagB/SusD family nutrient uptake outer membrane protein n=1 Tax=Pedobacter miscanthi TaxID=2259170 RepID=UPI00292D36E8|nr:RagB/SusD family nutrient uptake outer membrane protein [Pedobacter miscanthi]